MLFVSQVWKTGENFNWLKTTEVRVKGWEGRQCMFCEEWDVLYPPSPGASSAAQSGCHSQAYLKPHLEGRTWDTKADNSSCTKTHMVMAQCSGFYWSLEHAGFEIADNNFCLYLLWSVPGALPCATSLSWLSILPFSGFPTLSRHLFSRPVPF